LYVETDLIEPLWNALIEAAETVGGLPCGLGARDTLRLEAGMPLYGHELTSSINPLAAGLKKFVSLTKPENSPGKSALALIKEQFQESEVLIGLKMNDKRVPREGFNILVDGNCVGRITSGAPGPTVGFPIAMGYVQSAHRAVGTAVAVEIRKKTVAAEIVEVPFYSNPGLREVVNV